MTRLAISDTRAGAALNMTIRNNKISDKHNHVLQRFDAKLAELARTSRMAEIAYNASLEARFEFVASRVRAVLHYLNVKHSIISDFSLVFPGLALCANCSMRDWHAGGCSYAKGNGRLILHLKVDRINHKLAVLQAQPFRLSIPHGNKTCFLEYAGPDFAIFGTKSGCATAIPWRPVHDDQALVALHGSPSYKGQEIAHKNMWKVSKCVPSAGADPLETVQIVETAKFLYVYCPGMGINLPGHSSPCGESALKVPRHSNLTVSIGGREVARWSTSNRNLTGTVCIGVDLTERINSFLLPHWHPSVFLKEAEGRIALNELQFQVVPQLESLMPTSVTAALVAVGCTISSLGVLLLAWRTKRAWSEFIPRRAARLIRKGDVSLEEVQSERLPPVPAPRTKTSSPTP